MSERRKQIHVAHIICDGCGLWNQCEGADAEDYEVCPNQYPRWKEKDGQVYWMGGYPQPRLFTTDIPCGEPRAPGKIVDVPIERLGVGPRGQHWPMEAHQTDEQGRPTVNGVVITVSINPPKKIEPPKPDLRRLSVSELSDLIGRETDPAELLKLAKVTGERGESRLQRQAMSRALGMADK